MSRVIALARGPQINSTEGPWQIVEGRHSPEPALGNSQPDTLSLPLDLGVSENRGSLVRGVPKIRIRMKVCWGILGVPLFWEMPILGFRHKPSVLTLVASCVCHAEASKHGRSKKGGCAGSGAQAQAQLGKGPASKTLGRTCKTQRQEGLRLIFEGFLACLSMQECYEYQVPPSELKPDKP